MRALCPVEKNPRCPKGNVSGADYEVHLEGSSLIRFFDMGVVQNHLEEMMVVWPEKNNRDQVGNKEGNCDKEYELAMLAGERPVCKEGKRGGDDEEGGDRVQQLEQLCLSPVVEERAQRGDHNCACVQTPG